MKKFPRTVVILLLLLPLVLTSCLPSKVEQAMNACMNEVLQAEMVRSVEQLTSVLSQSQRSSWPLKCQRWALLVEIDQLELVLDGKKSDLEALDDQIDQQEAAQEKAAKTATAAALPTFTPTPTATLNPSSSVDPYAAAGTPTGP